MKEVQKTVTVFVAEDGREFTNAWQCKDYEDKLKINLEREQILTNGLRELISKVGLQYCSEPEKYTFKFDYDGGKSEIYYCNEEFDEDFPFEIEEWDEIERQMLIRYGFVLDISPYYWGK